MAAVQACMNPVPMDESDEDDRPLVFKRNNTVAKQNSTNQPLKNSSSQKPDGQSRKQASEVRSSNGHNSNSQKHKTIAPTKASQEKPRNSSIISNASAKSPIGNVGSTSSADHSKRPPAHKQPTTFNEKSPSINQKTSNSSAKPSPTGNPKVSSSKDDQSRSLPPQKSSPTVKEEKKSIDSAAKPENDSEDSEDTKPLSARMPSGSSKVNSNSASKEVSDSSKKSEVKTEDSDDEVPLSSKSLKKSNLGLSTSQSRDIDGKKPIGLKVQQNGTSMKDGQVKKCPTLMNKRPLSGFNNSSEFLTKKTKLMDGSAPSNSMQAPEKPKDEVEDEDEDHVPLSQRIKKASTSASKAPEKPKDEVEDEDEDHVPLSQRIKKASTSASKSPSVNKKATTKVVSKTTFKKKTVVKSKFTKSSKMQPGSGEGQKWTTLVHSGVIFPPPYKAHRVKMLYKGKPVDLTPEQEEVATMYAVMLETDYMTKPKFRENFMTDWKKILGKNHVIQKLEDCDFKPIYEWHQREKEKKKQMTTEEKKAIKEEKLKQEEKYMWAIVDGVKEKVGNFRVEPPGLFRGRGEHPKMGKLKRRIHPSDITINIGKNAPIPECPVPGESWREIRHDNTVTWLAFWNDPINPKEFKYVFLAANCSWKGQSDKEKYEKARTLKHYIQGIRTAYTKDFTSKDVTKRQIAIATYLIDKLALRAGNVKDDDEADTVGCCTLKVENVEPMPPHTLKFDFLGKDSIRYQNEVEVELPVYKAIQQFRVGKKGSDNLFDQLDTSKLNAVLKELMPGLTAKVFRTYNASITLDEMLSKGTKAGDVAEKVVVYQHANKEVAIICNHQRTVSTMHSAQMTRLNEKIDELKSLLDELKTDLVRARKGKPPLKGSDGKNKRNLNPEALERKIAQTNAKIEKMERDKDSKEDLKTVALGTSKINYLDPRITVAWCKRYEVPIEKMFNKALLAKFSWAMDVEPDFRF